MLKLKELDPTHNSYGNMIRERVNLLGYTLTELEQKTGIADRGLSTLLNGQGFPSPEKIQKLLEVLEFGKHNTKLLMTSIEYQKLHPVVKNPNLGFKLKAIRLAHGLTIDDLVKTSKELNKSNILQMEAGLCTIGKQRENAYIEMLKEAGVANPDPHVSKLEELLTQSEFSKVDIIAATLVFAKKYLLNE